MKIFLKLLIVGIILILISSAIAPASTVNNNNIKIKSNYKPQDEFPIININRIYIVAQVSGKIRISDTCTFTKSITPNVYLNIEMNGTVTNSTLLNPFTIWPPISIIPGLRMLFLPDNASIHINITRLRGKLYTLDEGETYRIQGDALIVIAYATVDLSEIEFPKFR